MKLGLGTDFEPLHNADVRAGPLTVLAMVLSSEKNVP
jgi:hypothetical protein